MSHWKRSFSTTGFALVLAALAGCTAIATVGCSGRASGRSSADAGAHLSPEQMLEDMAATYQAAKTYADSGELQLHFSHGQDQVVDERVDFAVTLARPNKLRMHFYQAVVVSDGNVLHATVADLDKQVLKKQVPEKLTLDFLYADEALRQALTEQIAGSSPQLALLLTGEFVKTVLTDSKSTTLLESESIDDERCERIKIARADGDLIFWIGQQSKTLKRIEFPTTQLGKQLEQQLGSPVAGLRLVAEFRGARLNPTLDDVAFQFEVPGEAKLVELFDLRALMPPPPAPSKLLGQKVGGFTFTRLDGSSVTPEELKGKVAIIDFWATWCGPCLENLPNLNRVYEKYKDDERVEFLAVSVDQAEVKPEQLQEAFAKIGAQVPIARDSSQSAFQAFLVEGIPNLFVLGPDGTVEDNEVGMNPTLADELPGRLEKLLAGQEIYKDAQQRYQERKARYEAALKEPLPQAEQQGSAAPQIKAEIAAKSQPASFALNELWSNSELKQPGNVLLVGSSDGISEVIVHDGWQKVVRLNEQGVIVGQQQLETPDTSVVSYLRTVLDRDGHRWFAGSASAQKQFYLLNDAFKPTLAYPSDEAEVSDVEFVHLDGDQTPQIAVSYWGNRGVELLDLDGKPRWKSAPLENVFRLAEGILAAGETPKLLAAHGRGSVAVLDAEGKSGSEIAVDKRFVRSLYAADLNHDGQSELVVLSPLDEGRDALLGIDASGKELWSYELPPGLHEQPIEHLTHGRVVGDEEQWIICGADGSIHLLSASGNLLDRFNYGEQLTGIAVGQIAGKPALVIASTKGIAAWGIESK